MENEYKNQILKNLKYDLAPSCFISSIEISDFQHAMDIIILKSLPITLDVPWIYALTCGTCIFSFSCTISFYISYQNFKFPISNGHMLRNFTQHKHDRINMLFSLSSYNLLVHFHSLYYFTFCMPLGLWIW